jgi:hypothetical protein
MKMMDRREFFKKLCVLSGSLIIPLGCSQDSSTQNSASSTTLAFSKQNFIDIIDTVFSVSHDMYGVIDLRLNLVADEIFIQEAEQFSISLAGPASPVLTEGTYDVYNDFMSNISLYLQPGEVSNGQQHYVAVFSLLNA